MKKILEDYGVIPENTNFGVKASVVSNMMIANGVDPKNPFSKRLLRRELSENATDGTVFLSCWMTAARVQDMKQRKVMFPTIELQ